MIDISFCQMTWNLKIPKDKNFRGCLRISLGKENLSSNFNRPSFQRSWWGSHVSWIIDRVASSSFIWHESQRKWKFQKFFDLIFPTRPYRNSKQKKKKEIQISQELRVISSFAIHHHSTCIHLSQMDQIIWKYQISKIFRVFRGSSSEGKFGLKLWRIISQEILIGQHCELDHWSCDIFLFHMMGDFKEWRNF